MHKTVLIEAELAKLKGQHCKILVVLKAHANAARQCWPSTRTIAEKTELSINTVQRALLEMESLGYVAIESRGRRRSHIYTIAERFAPSDQTITPLASRRKQRTNASPAPLFDAADHVPSDSEVESLSDSILVGLSDSPVESEVLQTKDSLPNGSAAGAAKPPPISIDPWSNAIAYLASFDIAERRARALIASWRRDHGDGPTIDALTAAEASAPIEPLSFITARLGGNHARSRGSQRPRRRSFAAVMFEAAQRMAEHDAEPSGRHDGDAALEPAGHAAAGGAERRAKHAGGV